ncbi:MAG: M48 family metallopeptidase [Planctomycetota bacterium]|jgi:STE24 endopeptidase
MRPQHLVLAAVIIVFIVYIFSLAFPYKPPIDPAKYFTYEEIARGTLRARISYIGWALGLLLTVAVLASVYFTRIGEDIERRTSRIVGDYASGWRRLVRIALYVIFLYVLWMVVRFPLVAIRGYVVSTRFGLGAPSFSSWFFFGYLPGHLMLLLEIIFVTVLVFGLMRRFPRFWWAVAAPVMLVLPFLYALIAPVTFDKLASSFKPLPEGEMRERLTGFAKKTGMPLPPIFIVDASKSSGYTNAYFTGIGPTKRIVLYDTLLEKNDAASVESIIAHEAGHWKHNHILIGILIGIPGAAFGAALMILLFYYLAKQSFFQITARHSVRAIPLFLFCALMLSYAQRPLFNIVSRHFERQADASAIEFTGDPESFIRAEVKLAKDNRSNLLPDRMAWIWFYTHPAPLDRIAVGEKALEKMKWNPGSGYGR